VFLALPGSNAHLELTSGGSHDAPAPHPESLLVLYLGDHSAIAAVTARIEAEPVASANPYWAAHGLTLEDPDGFRVVLVPESFPQPGLPAGAVRVELHRGPRPELRALFALAEDSAAQLDSYLDYGHVLVGLEGDQIVGQLQLTDTALPGAAEIKNMASRVPPAIDRAGRLHARKRLGGDGDRRHRAPRPGLARSAARRVDATTHRQPRPLIVRRHRLGRRGPMRWPDSRSATGTRSRAVAPKDAQCCASFA
jgi:hypothetical protein